MKFSEARFDDLEQDKKASDHCQNFNKLNTYIFSTMNIQTKILKK